LKNENKKTETIEKTPVTTPIPSVYRFVFTKEELEQIKINGDNTKQLETNFRTFLGLPERVKNTKKVLFLKKLGLTRSATQKEIMQKMEAILNEKVVNNE